MTKPGNHKINVKKLIKTVKVGIEWRAEPIKILKPFRTPINNFKLKRDKTIYTESIGFVIIDIN